MVGYGAKRNKSRLSRRIYRAINCKIVLRCSQLASVNIQAATCTQIHIRADPSSPTAITHLGSHTLRTIPSLLSSHSPLTAHQKLISPLHAPHTVSYVSGEHFLRPFSPQHWNFSVDVHHLFWGKNQMFDGKKSQNQVREKCSRKDIRNVAPRNMLPSRRSVTRKRIVQQAKQFWPPWSGSQ